MADKEKVVAENEEAETETTAEEIAPEEEAAPKSEEELLRDEVKDLKDKYLRLAAEYDNFRKRTAKEREHIFGEATVAAVSGFLNVYDNLERAIANPTEDENYKKGVELIFTQLKEVFSKLGVEILNPEGEAFDPNFHNAVMHEENENFGENTVCEVFQKGAKIRDRVIRPAMVKVAN